MLLEYWAVMLQFANPRTKLMHHFSLHTCSLSWRKDALFLLNKQHVRRRRSLPLYNACSSICSLSAVKFLLWVKFLPLACRLGDNSLSFQEPELREERQSYSTVYHKQVYCGLGWGFCQDQYSVGTLFSKLAKHLLRGSWATEDRLIPAHTIPHAINTNITSATTKNNSTCHAWWADKWVWINKGKTGKRQASNNYRIRCVTLRFRSS